jgi:hypothetical protein
MAENEVVTSLVLVANGTATVAREGEVLAKVGGRGGKDFHVVPKTPPSRYKRGSSSVKWPFSQEN